ncbi:MAG: hydroxypyruvate isomerase family protein [Bryobacteraceae bacterium]
MLRRDVLKLPAPLALGLSKPGGLKLSVRVEALFPGMALEAAMEKVAEARYEGFEFGDWRAQDANRIVKLQNRLGLECVCLVGNVGVNPKGMGLCDPAERAGFLKELRASVEAAKRFESKRLVVLSGFKVPGRPRALQHDSIVEGLKLAHDIVSPHGVTMIVEVVNTLAAVEPLNPKGNNHADYYLDRTDEAFAIARKTGSPFVKILYDTYHTQIMEGNLIETIRKNIALIGHFHIGDVPERHEPGTGEINFPKVFKAIKATGFEGYAGMEYVPSKDAMTALIETRAMAQRA